MCIFRVDELETSAAPNLIRTSDEDLLVHVLQPLSVVGGGRGVRVWYRTRRYHPPNLGLCQFNEGAGVNYFGSAS